MFLRVLPCALLALVWLSGCAFPFKKKPKSPMVASTPAPARTFAVGTVSLVNNDGRFVLVDNGSLPSPPVGGVLKCYPPGVQTPTAELVTTDVKKRPFTIADIREGVPQKGDRVIYFAPRQMPATNSPSPEPSKVESSASLSPAAPQ